VCLFPQNYYITSFGVKEHFHNYLCWRLRQHDYFDDETIEELREEFGDEIADKAKDINLCFHSDNLLKHMAELLMNTMDVQSLIEIALANPVAEDFNRTNPLNYAKKDFEKSWYHSRTANRFRLMRLLIALTAERKYPMPLMLKKLVLLQFPRKNFSTLLMKPTRKLSICL